MAIDLRGTARSGAPISYNDPQYAAIDANAENTVGLPSGSLTAIRTLGERSNADQISSAGARSVYQIIPATRDAVLQKYGVDAYAGPQQAALAAAHVYKEGLDRNNGNQAAAVGEYIGGPNRDNWGDTTHAYIARVTGSDVPGGNAARAPGKFNNGEPLPADNPMASFDPSTYYEQGFGLGPLDARKPLPPSQRVRADPRADLTANATGLVADNTPTGTQDVVQAEAGEDAIQARKDSYGIGDRFTAAWKSNSLSYALADAADRQHPTANPEWVQHYGNNTEEYDRPAQNQVELDALRASTSHADYSRILTDIQTKRDRQFVQYSGGNTTGLLYGLAGGIADPAGLAAAVITGGATEAALAGRAGWLATSAMGTIARLGTEGALGNVAVTAGLDLSGEHQTVGDYARAGIFGGVLGTLAAPLHLRGRANTEVADQLHAMAPGANENLANLQARAVANVGTDADIGAVNQEMRRLDTADITDHAVGALSPVPESSRLGPHMDDAEEAVQPSIAAMAVEPAPATIEAPASNMVGGSPKVGVAPANTGKDGKIYVGEAGQSHFDVMEKYPDVEWDGGTGFVDPAGNFLNREQALEYVNSNGEGIKSTGEDTELDALDYREQSQNIPPPSWSPKRAAWDAKHAPAAMDHELDEASISAPIEGVAKKPAEPHVSPDWITSDPKIQADIIDRHGLDAIPDEGTRAMSAELMARAEKVVEADPVNVAALKTVLKSIDMESTSNTLLSSDNVMAKAWGITMLENGQGAAGRRFSAAIDSHIREKVYLKQIADWDRHAADFRKGEGVGVMKDAWTGEARTQFNRRVFLERENRQRGIPSTEANPHIQGAANILDKGYDLMRRDAQDAKITGHARLGAESRGYQPHRISAGLAANLLDAAPERRLQRRAISKLIAEQLQGEDNTYTVRGPDGTETVKHWDKAFADEFANKYISQAAIKARGGWDVPLNLHDQQSATAVFDAMQAMNLPHDQAEALLGKFSRGGAQFTKGRLRLDLGADIPDGKGGTMKLGDLFNQDGLSLYRGYSRRMSGEIALAKRGIMGAKGVDVYRTAMMHSGASPEALRAFDQTAAELLNTPFGDSGHKYMDNIRVGASLMRLGGMGFTQLGEYGNALASMGVARTLTAIGGFKRLAAEVGQLAEGKDSTNAILKDLDGFSGGAGITDFHFSRLYDVPDNDIKLYNGETLGIGTRLLRAGSNVQAALSGHKMILGAQVRGMAEGITRKAIEYAKSGKEDIALDDMGITAGLRSRLADNLEHIATFKGGKLDTLDLHAGNLSGEEKQEFMSSILRGANQIIQHTYTGETGKWAHNGFLKILTQFRTFGIISIEKQWGRNKANYGAIKSFAYLLGAMSFAAPITMARLQLKTVGMSRSDREDYLAKNMTVAMLARSTMNYASASGVAGDIFDVGNGFAGGWMGGDYADGVGLRGQGQGDVADLVPALGAVNDIWKGTHGNPHKLVGILPGSTLPFVQPAINGLSSPSH